MLFQLGEIGKARLLADIASFAKFKEQMCECEDCQVKRGGEPASTDYTKEPVTKYVDELLDIFEEMGLEALEMVKVAATIRHSKAMKAEIAKEEDTFEKELLSAIKEAYSKREAGAGGIFEIQLRRMVR